MNLFAFLCFQYFPYIYIKLLNMAREIRLTNVPEALYMHLLELKAKEEQRLRRVCTFTDAVKRLYSEKHTVTIDFNDTGIATYVGAKGTGLIDEKGNILLNP